MPPTDSLRNSRFSPVSVMNGDDDSASTDPSSCSWGSDVPVAMMGSSKGGDRSGHGDLVEKEKTSSSRDVSRRSVGFSENDNKIYTIPHWSDMPEDVASDLWYDDVEYERILEDMEPALLFIEGGDDKSPGQGLDGGAHVTRGLEFRTRAGAWKRHEVRRDALNAVLDEQERQWLDPVGKECPDEIARIYSRFSARCSTEAVVRAKLDERDAIRILRSIIPPKRWRRMKAVTMLAVVPGTAAQQGKTINTLAPNRPVSRRTRP